MLGLIPGSGCCRACVPWATWSQCSEYLRKVTSCMSASGRALDAKPTQGQLRSAKDLPVPWVRPSTNEECSHSSAECRGVSSAASQPVPGGDKPQLLTVLTSLINVDINGSLPIPVSRLPSLTECWISDSSPYFFFFFYS